MGTKDHVFLKRRGLMIVALAVTFGCLMSVAHAQFGRWGGVGEGNMPPRFPPPSFPDRDFAFCKLMYESVRYEDLGMGWSTDYPYAGINHVQRYSSRRCSSRACDAVTSAGLSASISLARSSISA